MHFMSTPFLSSSSCFNSTKGTNITKLLKAAQINGKVKHFFTEKYLGLGFQYAIKFTSTSIFAGTAEKKLVATGENEQ